MLDNQQFFKPTELIPYGSILKQAILRVKDKEKTKMLDLINNFSNRQNLSSMEVN